MSDLKRYLAIEIAGGASWSPKSDRIAFAYNSPGSYQIYSIGIMKDLTLWPKRLTHEQNRCTNPHWLADGTIVFTSDVGGNERFQLGVVGTDGTVSWVSKDKSAKHIINFATSKHLYYVANVENRSRLDLYRLKIPVLENEPELIYRPKAGIASAHSVSLDEKKVIVQQYLGSSNQELILVEPDHASKLNISRSVSGMSKNRWSCLRFIDNNSLLVATDFGSDYMRLNFLTLDANIFPIYEAMVKMEIDGCAISENSQYSYIAYNKNGYSRLYTGIFTSSGVSDFHEIPLPMPSVITSGDSRSFSKGMALSPDGRFIALTLSSSTMPVNVWILDTRNEYSWMATDVDMAGIRSEILVNETLHKIPSFDLLNVPYFKYLPKGEKPPKGWPTIIMIHGGPESQFKPSFNIIVQFIVSNGFAVVAPNIRGSTGYGRKYMDLDNVEKRLDSISDIKYIALHLNDNDPDIDGDNLIVYGRSYGGFAVLSTMTEHPDLWLAGVEIVGISSFITFLQNTASWRRSLRQAEYGSLERDRELLERISPINHVDKLSAPLFIVQGANDERVPLSESMQIYEAVRSRGIPTEIIVLEDEGHGISSLKNRLMVYPRIIEWLKGIIDDS